MKVGDKVFCKDVHGEFTGWIASIDDNVLYPYVVVDDMENIGKTYLELSGGYEVYELESLTLLQDDQCQYCNLTKRELKIVQSELNDAYVMLQNRDNKIKELEEKQMSNIRKALENENVSEDMIKKVLKELGIKENKRWVPEIGEIYWIVNRRHRVMFYKCVGDEVDRIESSMGNVFKTKEEAEHHRDKSIFLAQMKIDFEDNSDEIDWSDDNQRKYIVCFDHIKNKIEVTWWCTTQQGVLHTTNKEWLAQYIIDNEQQIKKYYFDVE